MKKELENLIYKCKAFCKKYDTEYVDVCYRHDSEYHFGLGCTQKNDVTVCNTHIDFEEPLEMTIEEIEEKLGLEKGSLRVKGVNE